MSREARSETPFVDFAAGSTILREGDAASALFIIEAGKVAIERSDLPGVALAELGPGEFFGEMSILQEQPHSANAVAKTAVRALRIDAAAFHAVLRENIEIGVHLMRRLVLRLKHGEQRRHELEAQLARALGGRAAAPSAPPVAASGAPAVSATPAVAATPAAKPVPAASVPAAAAAPAQAVSAPAASPAAAKPTPAAAAMPAGAPAPASSVPAASVQPATAGATIAIPPGAAAPPASALPAAAPVAAAVPGAPRRYTLRHADGAIAFPEGRNECLVGRPDPATGAIPEINLGPLDLARSLSRRHARFLVADGAVALREEPGVANGTWVNGEKLAPGQTVALKPGDRLRFGAIELELSTA